MRVLLSTIGTRGDVQPLVAVALTLRAAGHGARLCVPEDYCDWIQRLGFPATPIAPVPWRASAPGARPDLSPERVQAAIAGQFDVLLAAARDCDVLVSAAVLPPARSVTELLGIGYAFAAICPVMLPSPYHPPIAPPTADQERPNDTAVNTELWARLAESQNARLGPALNRCRESAGLDSVDDVFSHVMTSRPWLSADPVLGPWPDPAGGTALQTGAWVARDDRPLPGDLEAFLRAGESPVYVGFGSMPMEAGLAEVILAAARQAGRRAIIASGRAGLALASREPDCLVIGDVNTRTLFGQVAAVVHHGGAGTTAAAGLAGVPQVVVPQRFDQPYWARRVRDLGIGIAHPSGTPTADSLADALGHALTPGVAARARSVSGAMTKDGAQVAVGHLLTIPVPERRRQELREPSINSMID